jgi:pyruvate kinase
MANAVNNMTHNLGAKAILVMSQSGMSVASIASTRPAAPVVAISSNEQVCRRMALLWSVIPILKKETGRTNPNHLARQAALELELAEKGKYVLLVRGFHSNDEMNTPTITTLMV